MEDFPTIFISHSSAEDADQAALLKAIKAKFAADFEILLDQDLLKAGDTWRNELHTWMAMCQAAIVILSPGVLEHEEWVLKEFTILSWRRSLDPNFVLIPVLLPTVQRSNFDKGLFAPLLVRELQMAEGDPAQIIDELETRLKDLRGREPSHVANLIDNIAGKLAKLTDRECRQAALALDGEPLRWDSRLTEHERLARRMVHANFTKLCHVLIEKSPRIGQDAACEILEWLFTFWIEPEAVVSIPQVVTGPHRAIALNATHPRTPRLYIRRAFCNYPPGSIEAPINDDGGELAVEDVEQQLRDFFRSKDPALMRAKEVLIQQQIEVIGAEVDAKPIFVIIERALKPEDLRRLQGKYPRFTFVLATGAKLPDDDYYASSVRLLRPELDPRKEVACQALMTETRANILGTP